MVQSIALDEVVILLSAPLWQYIWYTTFPSSFAFSPYGLVYIPYYGLSVYLAWLAYNTARKQNIERKQYAWRTAITIALQVVVILLIPPFSGSPQPLNIPLPIVGIVALLLTKQTVKELTSPWEEQEDLFESEKNQA
ncbi:MAG: hypothetical protein ACXADC_00710 [Candidatus Thorarchaeota archaeon]|jgi:hypothetical protein